MNYTIYDSATGEISHVISVSNPDRLVDMMEYHSAIEGHWSSDDYYIHNGEVQSKPATPGAPHVQYDFDYATHTWSINSERTGHEIRRYRNSLLDAVDRVNPVRYLALTAQQQQQLADYRLALLAVPQQSGYPESLEWPVKPDWL